MENSLSTRAELERRVVGGEGVARGGRDGVQVLETTALKSENGTKMVKSVRRRRKTVFTCEHRQPGQTQTLSNPNFLMFQDTIPCHKRDRPLQQYVRPLQWRVCVPTLSLHRSGI